MLAIVKGRSSGMQEIYRAYLQGLGNTNMGLSSHWMKAMFDVQFYPRTSWVASNLISDLVRGFIRLPCQPCRIAAECRVAQILEGCKYRESSVSSSPFRCHLVLQPISTPSSCLSHTIRGPTVLYHLTPNSHVRRRCSTPQYSAVQL